MRGIGVFLLAAGITALASVAATGTAMASKHDASHDVLGSEEVDGGTGGDQLTGGMLMPIMSPARGRKLFASKGCVVCHSINGVGGEDAPALDAEPNEVMNLFDFTAKMWRGAATMIAMQEEELGGQIEFTGAELADIVAFAHDPAEQKKFSETDIPSRIKKFMARKNVDAD